MRSPRVLASGFVDRVRSAPAGVARSQLGGVHARCRGGFQHELARTAEPRGSRLRIARPEQVMRSRPVDLGAVCNHAAECKPVAGKEPACKCAGGTPETVCMTLLDVGDRCNGPVGCRSGSTCTFQTGADGPTCEAFAPLGASCVEAVCAPASSCDGSVCVPARAIGQACDWIEVQPCQAGAHCSMSGVCEADLPEGAACSSQEACGVSGECISFSGVPACVRRRNQGEACQRGSDCGEGLTCDDDHCVPRTRPGTCGF
jgi:hypothetical protein